MCVMHKVARRRVPRIARKHGFLPVPSYGLPEAKSLLRPAGQHFSLLPLRPMPGRLFVRRLQGRSFGAAEQGTALSPLTG
jgi:hypothetical protein